MNNKELGIIGENIACELLIKKGYKILHRNWSKYKLELDVVTEYDNRLIIVEVKTRESNYLGEPWEAVTLAKQKNIIKATNEYVAEYQIDLEVQFDVISIIYREKCKSIEHLENAFYPRV